MKYSTYEIKVENLIHLIEESKIDLKPSYQRNEVWTRKDQESLIDSILQSFPIPNFFFFKRSDGTLEMVDGQQRARAIFSFYKGLITDSSKKTFDQISQETFLNYKINVTEINEVYDESTIRQFYVLVNKKGIHLNKPEINKAEFAATRFFALVEHLLEMQDFTNLELFTDAVSRRMNDRSYMEELVVYLIMGITDKKNAVDKIYTNDIDEHEQSLVESRFEQILSRLTFLNNYRPVNTSRYKQRNDFYTLFNFINEGIEIDSNEVLLYQYKILLAIENYISPSNEQCIALQNYAYNCITQSNSKKARVERLNLFNQILRNQNPNGSAAFQDVYNFLVGVQQIHGLANINGYVLFELNNG